MTIHALFFGKLLHVWWKPITFAPRVCFGTNFVDQFLCGMFEWTDVNQFTLFFFIVIFILFFSIIATLTGQAPFL